MELVKFFLKMSCMYITREECKVLKIVLLRIKKKACGFVKMYILLERMKFF